MSAQSLSVSLRTELKKSKTKQLRSKGLTPAVIVGGGQEGECLSFDYRDLEKIFRNNPAGRNTLISLSFNDSKQKPVDVLTYHIDLDPVTHRPLHVDFLLLDNRESVVVSCPISHVSKSKGEVAGGSLLQMKRKVKLECAPQNIPPILEIDIKDLDIGDALKVKDADIPTNVTVLSDPHDVLFRVIKQRGGVADASDETGETDENGAGDAQGSDS